MIRSVLLSLALVGLATAARAEGVPFTELSLYGMDSRDLPPGKTVYDPVIYNRVAMITVPRGRAVTDVNTRFLITGDTLGFAAYDCPRDKQRIVYDTAGAHRDSYTCKTGGETTRVRLSTNVSREGSLWTMEGRSEVTGPWLGGAGTIIHHERIVLDITNAGCRLVSYVYRSEDRRPGKAGTIKRGKPGAKCFMIP